MAESKKSDKTSDAPAKKSKAAAKKSDDGPSEADQLEASRNALAAVFKLAAHGRSVAPADIIAAVSKAGIDTEELYSRSASV